MLSAVLRSDAAIRVSIKIMDTFVEMRKYMANTSLLYERLNAMEIRQINYQAETDERFEKVFEYISEHEEVSQKAVSYTHLDVYKRQVQGKRVLIGDPAAQPE